MNIFIRHAAFKGLLVAIIAGGILSCSQIRQLTYPEDFTYLEKEQVKTLMKQMGDSVGRLGQLVANDAKSETKQQQVLTELSTIESITARLSGGHAQTNQIFIRDHIEQFISDVGTAKLYVKTTPPDYSKAKKITNSCQECHQLR